METDSYSSSFFNHKSVMTQEILDSIDYCSHISFKEFYGIDATLGGGGHSYELLKKYNNLKIIGLDQDPNARNASAFNLREFQKRITIYAYNFAEYIPSEKVSFIIADLGVSSDQIDKSERGFSFLNDGPLDMRMNPKSDMTAEKLIKEISENDLADIIYKYGDERLSRKIAYKIKKELKDKGNFSGTKALAYTIAGCFPPKQRYRRIHPATRTFQALRIAVNKEIDVLKTLLDNAQNWLMPGGIIAIISFHSIEDRMVKNHFKNDIRLIPITKKPLTPSEDELLENKRSRSAKLRIAQLKEMH